MVKRRTMGERIVAARKAKGLNLWRSARRLGVSPWALWGWEQGRKDVPLDVRQAMAALYGTAPQYLVPNRPAAAEHDVVAAVIRVGSAAFTLGNTDGESLRRFLAAVREERGLAPGAPLALRESDAALLADLLGGSPEEIIRSLQRLLGLTEDDAAEFSRWLFGRTAVAAVFALGLTLGVAGTAAFADGRDRSTGAGSPAATPASQPSDGDDGLNQPLDPNWAVIGEAAVLYREDVPNHPAP